ncbi:MAG: hypothetical protein ACR2NN_27825 [Bryobacteraceae bacterium]
MRIEKLKRYKDDGALFNGDARLMPVHYDLQLSQEMIDNGLGGEIPGLQRIDGSLSTGNTNQDLYPLINADDLVLHMADGQRLGLFIADTRTGRIGNRTGFYRSS